MRISQSNVRALLASADPFYRFMLRHLLFNVLVATCIGIAITWFVNTPSSLLHNLTFSYCVAFTILLLHCPTRLLLQRHAHVPFGWQLCIYVAAVVVGNLVDCELGSVLTGIELTDRSISVLCTCVGGSFGMLYAISVERKRRADEAERTAAMAQLRVLQAQVEPHFLFNTLASLDALIATDAGAARIMLGHLNRYLRASLLHARGAHANLETEFTLLSAYLGIMAMRLPDRLRLQIDCAPDCAALPFPPMLVQPLVENAVTHGVEPSREGGTVAVAARLLEDRLLVSVSDTGVGWGYSPHSGTGTGLSNVRERLWALYGGAASLHTTAQPRGTRVEISIPLDLLAREAA